MTRAGVLDLGSNSFHVLVAEVDGQQLWPVLRSREMLHLGRTVERDGALGTAALRAAEVAQNLAELARRGGAAALTAVATAAIRDAADREQVLADLHTAVGAPVRVLTGDEEARLTYLGVRASLALPDQPVATIDLGGGSVDVAVGSGNDVDWTKSVPLGASRMSALVATDPPSPDDMATIERRLDEHLAALEATFRHATPAVTVAVGGAVRAIARLIGAKRATWMPTSVNQMTIARTELQELRDELLAADLATRSALRGMKTRRADHVHVATAILCRLVQTFDIEQLVISDWGLREGLLLDEHGQGPPRSATQLRHDEVQRLQHAMLPVDEHAQQVARLATELFDQLQTLHGLDDLDRQLLDAAAHLHSIGRALVLRRYQDHGAYLVQHAELRGYSPDEIALLATLIRFHPSHGIDHRYPPFSALSERDQDRAERLLALLQVADALDTARDQSVAKLAATVDEHQAQVELAVTDNDGMPAAVPLVDSQHQRRFGLFERTFSVSLTIVDDTVDRADDTQGPSA